jgi:hypothetical protein
MDSFEYIASTNNAVLQAFAILNKCLLNNGALKPGQFSGAIKETFDHPEADWNRPDYELLQHLANLLDRAEDDGRRATSGPA